MQIKQISQEDMLIFKAYFFNQLEKAGIKEKGVHQKHDKSFKFILSNQKEMADFLKQFLDIDIEGQKLEEQKNNFINENFEKRESDVIYKIKDTEIYFLIEHQSSVDENMPERILKYSLEIRRVVQENQIKRTKVLVVPIVLYTGKRKWNVSTNFASMQISNKKYKRFRIKQKYELIDINEYTKNDLIRKNTKMSSMLLIEKCKTKEELIETLIDLIDMAEEDRIEWLEKVVEYILPDILGENKNIILKMLKGKEKKEMDDEWVETIMKNEEKKEKALRREGRREGKREGKREGRREGKKETILEIIKNMLELKQDEKTIMKFTKAKKSDIEEAKKEMQMQGN